MQNWKAWARRLKLETYALYLACRDPRTPWYARALAIFVVAHTFSPIDLIPDFIPVLGYLDDLIITPGGLWLALRLIPPEVMAEARRKAAGSSAQVDALGRAGGAIVIIIWLVVLLILGTMIWRAVRQSA